MNTRTRQREETCERIITAAALTFSEKGFQAASTRDIAARAGVNQGLITYYFKSKEKLWKVAVDRIFADLTENLGQLRDEAGSDDPRERARRVIRQYVRFVAAHPELFRLMVEEGKRPDARLRWLVDRHLKPLYERFTTVTARLTPNFSPALLPHVFYSLSGAGSMIFALRPECRRLTGVDPAEESVVETHADYVARLLVP